MPKSIAELNRLYDEAVSADNAAFAEFRTNVLLASGEHYSGAKGGGPALREARQAHESQKLRITKNHIHRVVREYKASVLQGAPGVTVEAAVETDLQCQKAAEQNESVRLWAEERYRLKELHREWLDDFVKPGEVCLLLRWDPLKGDFKGYEQAVDEMDQPVFDEMGQPVADETKPVYSGDFVWDSKFAANVFRHPGAKKMRDSPCIGFRSMAKVEDLKARYKDQPEKLAKIVESESEEYVVFDSNKQGYEMTRGQTCIREYYYRPCHEYPKGYYYITTKTVILEEGELPFGIWPIAWAGMDKNQETPRAKSIIKVARPYVAELNRASSQQALQQLTLGDDKILYQKGSKLEQGALLPGVRGVSYSGREPTILPGRDGGQFTGYLQATEQEMDRNLMLQKLHEEKFTQVDPMTLLYKAASQSQVYGEYTEVFEQFLVDVYTIFFELSRRYLPDDIAIPAMGRTEMVNIAEFRNGSPIHTRIKVKPRSDTIESKLGKQLLFQNILQYAGKQLSKEDIGKLVKAMPYANFEGAFDDFTLDYDNAKNDILALDRGEYPPISPKDKPDYMIQQLSARQRRRDYQFLHPAIQQNYERRIQEYGQLETEQMAKIKAAQAEFIPVDGALVKCDVWVQDPNSQTGATKRAALPQRALEWLIKQLETQGATLEKLEKMNQGALAEIAQQFTSQQAQQFGGMQPQLPPGGMMPFAS